ncbi:hypothetical protein [Verrucosispora sp. NA02020]|uniref:hypothetical protein n=1 Tax=Verrucosispora sp. NA02020 TaxID=2742132 RepID=UPI00159007A9|nr:hypothetical protein [Verrucosispora sp. NA02020]QKW15391.1 hypothetical protein HUT12_23240 [Verrucosispora sp. NA02020]
MNEGICHGGPLDGQTVVSRGDSGLLVADKPSGRAWLYDWRDGAFHLREERRLDEVRAVDAAMDGGWDVIALPGEVVSDGDR